MDDKKYDIMAINNLEAIAAHRDDYDEIERIIEGVANNARITKK